MNANERRDFRRMQLQCEDIYVCGKTDMDILSRYLESNK
jgi:hypothetical protein